MGADRSVHGDASRADGQAFGSSGTEFVVDDEQVSGEVAGMDECFAAVLMPAVPETCDHARPPLLVSAVRGIARTT